MKIRITRDGGQTLEMMDEELLEKKTGEDVDANGTRVRWVEYWLSGRLVHRSAHVGLGKMPEFKE